MSVQRDAASNREHRPKRIKIDVACDTCRTRKVKCDGVRPACGNCSRKLALRGTCRYDQTGGQPNSSRRRGKAHSSNLIHDAISDQCSSSVSFYGDMGPQRPQSSAQSPARQGPRCAPRALPPESESSDAISPNNISTIVQAAVNTSTDGPSVIDSMTAVVDEGTSTREYFGSSSAGSFTTQIKKAIDARLGKDSSASFASRVSSQHTGRVMPVAPGMVHDANRVLPTRRQADQLLSIYWQYVNPLYPFYDKSRWDKSYFGIFNGLPIEADEQIFLATLNVAFALSSQLLESQTPQQREEASRVYFNRARELLPLNTWEPASIELVQYLLLTSQYLQSTDHPHQTWMVVGSAVRIAQSLGLHLPETSANQSDANEQALLRRIWYGCVLMDRIVAVTHGRPSMISSHIASAVPLPSSHKDSYNNRNNELDLDPADTSFFVKSVELYEIIHQTIQTIYNGARGESTAVHASDGDISGANPEKIDIGSVMELDSMLGKWERNLPQKLKWSSSQPRSQVAQRQSVILYLRFLHARILLFRPILGSFCLAHQGEPFDATDTLEARSFRECALMCVSTAQETIAEVFKNQKVDEAVGPLPAWWYRIYYVYTAATVLIAAKLRLEVFPGPKIGRSWAQAMSVLKTHEKFGQSARRCGTALQLLSAKINQDGAAPEVSGRGLGQRREGINENDSPQRRMIVPDAPAENDFSFNLDDIDEQGLQHLDFDVNNLSWLNELHATWELFN